MKEGALVTKAKTRSWPGLGKNEFNNWLKWGW